MTLLNNIGIVARYEAKILRRSWFFRLFSIGALVIFTFMNIGLFSPVGDEDWALNSNPASVPLLNLYILNIAQAIVVIFLAADFLKRDKKVDTNEVLYTRSMSNFEYVIGKSWGILRLFLGLDIIILAIGLLMNIISKDMKIDAVAYISYLLIICVPTILFSLGLAFMLMSVIRNQAITFLVLLGIAALNMFWLWYRFGFIFDYMAFGFPVVKSQEIGFDNPGQILSQRLLYTFLGLAFILSTVLLFKRLPQSKILTGVATVFMIIFLAGSVFCGFRTWSYYKNDIADKNAAIETNRKYENTKFVSLTDVAIDFIHKGNLLEATARLRFVNDNREAVRKYIFSINPDLGVTEVRSDNKELQFSQINNIIDIDPGIALEPGYADSLEISYSGSINQSFCFPDYKDNLKETPYRLEMLNIHKRQAFLTDDYVLLTPESHWYPVAGLNYYPSNPARIKVDFTMFTLRVRTGSGLNVVSQGIMKSEEGLYIFTPESPLTGLTLAIGDYSSDTLKVDSVKYISYYFPEHDYYKKDLAELKDTLHLLVSGIMRELETNFSTKYPFKTLSLLEVPVQFFSYPRMNTQTRAELQPSMVLLPEKLSTLQNAGFRKQFQRQKKRMARSNQVITDKELQVRLFNNFVRNTFITGENVRFVNGIIVNEPLRYRLGPSFYFFKNNFYSSEYPVINAVFESHLQKVNTPQGGFRNFMGDLSDNDKANLILKTGSFRDILAMNPGTDTIRQIITIKGDYLFNLIRSKAGIEEFKTWFQAYIEDHKFRRVDIFTFNDDIRKEFGFEFYPYLHDWYITGEQPGFIFSGLQANEIVTGDRVRYLVTFTASNPEPVPGIFNVAVRTGGPGGPGRGGGQIITTFQGPGGSSTTFTMQGRGMEASDISRIVTLGPREAKKIKIILDAQPRDVMINTLISRNVPGEITLPIDEIVKSKNRAGEYEGEEILSSIPALSEPGEIIVDNEDPGFDPDVNETSSPLKKLLGIEREDRIEYTTIRMFGVPEYWQPVVLSDYYGKYILSSVYTRSGTGDRSVKWTTEIKEPGYYDIYCFIGKAGSRMTIRVGRGGPGGPGAGRPGAPPGPPGAEQQGQSSYKDMHYRIYHDEGIDEITVDFENAEAGWNNLGRYYLSPDSAKVELTNQSTGRVVLGDAIRWVKVD